MTEKEMEDLLWDHPEKLLNERLKQFRRQPRSQVGRADLVFENKFGHLLVVELKRGTLPRGAIEQLHDYYGMMKNESPDKPVELMVVANTIPVERRRAAERLDIDYQEISEKKFRDIASEVGYEFKSEIEIEGKGEQEAIVRAASASAFARASGLNVRETAWYYWVDSEKKEYFLAFVNAKGSCSIRPFDAVSGKAYKKPKNPKGDYREVYKTYLQSAVRLPINPKVSLEKECKERLPSPILEMLRKQVPRNQK